MTILEDSKGKMPRLRRPRKRRLRKQPKLRTEEKPQRRRVKAAVAALPLRLTRRKNTAEMPSSAQRRVWKMQTRPIWLTTKGIRELIWSSRSVSLILLVMCCTALYMAGQNERFYLNAIDIEGVSYLAENQILQTSGLAGLHIFDVEPHDAAARVGKLPGILSAEVEVEWPDNTRIVIEEDTPLAVWEENGQRYWINAGGELIPLIDPDVDLVMIVADLPPVMPKAPDLNLGIDPNAEEEDIFRPNTQLPFVPIDVLNGAILINEIRPELSEFQYTSVHGLSYQDAQGLTVHMGTGGDMRYKVSVSDTLLTELTERGIAPEYIDVSSEEAVFYKPVGGLPPVPDVEETVGQ